MRALSEPDEVRRESAIARLAVIGARAVPHILTAYRTASDRAARLALMRALEPMGDGRTIPVARSALAEGGDLAIAATAVLRELLESTQGRTGPEALDALMATALSPATERRVRVAAKEALQHIPEVRRQLAEALANDPDASIRERGRGAAERPGGDDAVWHDALDGHLPDDPRVLREALDAFGARAALGALQKLVDRIRAREEEEAAPRSGWRALRGSVHQVLALRGSRVALYDLRESLEQADAELPASFLAAAQLVGDGSCLEALASAYERTNPDDERWRAQLAAAFRTVAAREHITRRHGTLKRIAGRWPEAARHLIDRV